MDKVKLNIVQTKEIVQEGTVNDITEALKCMFEEFRRAGLDFDEKFVCTKDKTVMALGLCPGLYFELTPKV